MRDHERLQGTVTLALLILSFIIAGVYICIVIVFRIIRLIFGVKRLHYCSHKLACAHVTGQHCTNNPTHILEIWSTLVQNPYNAI